MKLASHEAADAQRYDVRSALTRAAAAHPALAEWWSTSLSRQVRAVTAAQARITGDHPLWSGKGVAPGALDPRRWYSLWTKRGHLVGSVRGDRVPVERLHATLGEAGGVLTAYPLGRQTADAEAPLDPGPVTLRTGVDARTLAIGRPQEWETPPPRNKEHSPDPTLRYPAELFVIGPRIGTVRGWGTIVVQRRGMLAGVVTIDDLVLPKETKGVKVKIGQKSGIVTVDDSAWVDPADVAREKSAQETALSAAGGMEAVVGAWRRTWPVRVAHIVATYPEKAREIFGDGPPPTEPDTMDDPRRNTYWRNAWTAIVGGDVAEAQQIVGAAFWKDKAWRARFIAALGASATPAEHRYGAQYRPPGFGTVPKGMVRVDPPLPGVPETRHGVAVFDRPLTDEEVRGYELAPYIPLADVVDRMFARVDRYGENYAEELRRGKDAVLRSGLGGVIKEDFFTDVPKAELWRPVAAKLLAKYPAPPVDVSTTGEDADNPFAPIKLLSGRGRYFGVFDKRTERIVDNTPASEESARKLANRLWQREQGIEGHGLGPLVKRPLPYSGGSE